MQTSDFIYTSESFDDARTQPQHQVPILRATSENLRGFGTLVADFHCEPVVRQPWPKAEGWRPLIAGCGASQALVESDYIIRWSGDVLYGDNLAFKDVAVGFALGKLADLDHGRDRILVRDTNYHPDGGQVFFPKNGQPFVMLMAPAVGDDVTVEMFRAFWFDGAYGFNIAPNVWHQAPLCSSDVTVFLNKQSSVFACVGMDSVIEFGKYMSVPLEM